MSGCSHAVCQCRPGSSAVINLCSLLHELCIAKYYMPQSDETKKVRVGTVNKRQSTCADLHRQTVGLWTPELEGALSFVGYAACVHRPCCDSHCSSKASSSDQKPQSRARKRAHRQPGSGHSPPKGASASLLQPRWVPQALPPHQIRAHTEYPRQHKARPPKLYEAHR